MSTATSRQLHSLLLCSIIFFSSITTIISAVLVSLEVRSTSHSKHDKYHPSAMELLVTASITLLYFLGVLLIWRLQGRFEIVGGNGLGFWKLFGWVAGSEIILISLYLGGSVSLILESYPPLKTLAAFGFISLSLVFSHLLYLSVRTYLLIRKLSAEDSAQKFSFKGLLSIPTSEIVGDRAEALQVDLEKRTSGRSRSSSGSKKTIIPPSSNAWPSSVPVLTKDFPFKRSATLNQDTFTQPPKPTWNPMNYSPRRPLKKPNEDNGELVQWSNRHANDRFNDEMRIKDGSSKGMQAMRDRQLLMMNTRNLYGISEEQKVQQGVYGQIRDGRKPSELFSKDSSPNESIVPLLPTNSNKSSPTSTSSLSSSIKKSPPAPLNFTPPHSANIVPPPSAYQPSSVSTIETPLPSSVPTFFSSLSAFPNRYQQLNSAVQAEVRQASWVEVKTKGERGIAVSRPMVRHYGSNGNVGNKRFGVK